jgi:LysR family hydrogen peroxide-inducible transcriptional activator
MNIQQIEYVLAVVDLKNFQLAAETCYVTQSTLSTMIGKLEAEIGIKIFNRKTKPVTITAEGKAIIESMRRVIYEIDAMKNVVAELKGKLEGELKIGVIPTIAPYLLPLISNEFASALPEVNIKVKEMTTAEISEALKIRTLDIGILALPLDDTEINEVQIYSEPFLVYDCTDSDHDKKVTLENLDYTKICLLEEGHCLRTQVQKICELSNLYPSKYNNFDFQSGSMESLLRITKSRKGLTIIPHLAMSNFSKEDLSKIIEFQSPQPARMVGLVTNKFFVKKKLLEELRRVIQKVITPLLPQNQEQQIVKPV